MLAEFSTVFRETHAQHERGVNRVSDLGIVFTPDYVLVRIFIARYDHVLRDGGLEVGDVVEDFTSTQGDVEHALLEHLFKAVGYDDG